MVVLLFGGGCAVARSPAAPESSASPSAAGPETAAASPAAPEGVTWPTAPPAQICSSPANWSGPATPPSGAIIVPAGDNSELTQNWNDAGFSQAGKTFWFAPGVHTVGSDDFAQIQPGNGSAYVGGPGAIIDGQHKALHAFAGDAPNVTIEYLTIRNFGTGKSNNDQGTVNHDGGEDWIIEYNYIHDNDGAGVFIGSGNRISYNCLKDNGQYGFSAYQPGRRCATYACSTTTKCPATTRTTGNRCATAAAAPAAASSGTHDGAVVSNN